MFETNRSSSPHTFVLTVADLTSPYFPNRVFDIRNLMIDIDIFENINKPYLTGTATFQDDNSVYSAINFRGIETLTLGFRLPEDTFKEFKKTFYVDKIIRTQRANDQQAVIMVHLVEDIGYTSEFVNVNKAYQGSGTKIITDVFRDFFGTVVDVDQQTIEVQPPFKVVVPNITPMETAQWIKDKITADNGAPFYLYSTFGDKNVQLKNWQTMALDQLFSTNTFIYSQSQTNNDALGLNQQAFIIENFQDGETSDLSKLNDSGFVNAKYFFHDVNTNTTFAPGHSVPTESYGAIQTLPVGKRWSARGMFNYRYFENRPEANVFQRINDVYPGPARLPWAVTTSPTDENADRNPFLHTRPESRIISQIFSSQSYAGYNNYAEAGSDADFLLKVDSKALRNWIVSSPITVTVPGRLFLAAKSSATLGRKYKFQFTTFIGGVAAIDSRRTGDYIIFGARHSFTRDMGYRVHLTGVGLRNRGPRDADLLTTSAEIDNSEPVVPFVGPR